MKTCLFTTLLWVLFAPVPGPEQAVAQTDQRYWDENVAILDMRIRTVSPTAYVREIRLLDFNGQDLLSPDFGLGLDLFTDDGTGFDLEAGDGVYTSERCYAHNPAKPFFAHGHTAPAVGQIIIDADFKYLEHLYAREDVQKRIAESMPKPLIVRCNLKKCACPSSCICFACEWGSGAWCLDWCDCQAAITLQW